MQFKIISLLLFVLSVFTYSQQDEFIISRMQSSDEYPYKLTYTMLQDNNGFLWFGTMHGLLRYDGLQTVLFRNNIDDSTSLGFDDIVSLYQDSKGNIWIGTWGGGVVKYDLSSEKFSTFIAEKNGLSDNIVWAITEDTEGNIWFGTQSKGLSVYSPEEKSFSSFDKNILDKQTIPKGYISTLLTDSKGDIWIGTPQGLHKYISKEKIFRKYILDKIDTLQVQTNNITSIIELDNNIWVSTRNGLFFYERVGESFSRFNLEPFNSINSLSKDNKGLIWLGTTNGLVRFNPDDSKVLHLSEILTDPLLKTHIGAMMIDASGVVWACSYEYDLLKIANKPKVLSNSLIKDSLKLSSTNILSFTSDDKEDTWIGTSKGLIRMNMNGIISDVPGLNKYPIIKAGIISLCKVKDELFVGTRRGLFVYKTSSDELMVPEPLDQIKQFRINSLIEDRKKNLWIGTYDHGVYKYDRTADSLIHFDLKNYYEQNENSNFILTIYEDKAGRIWIGTYAGLYLYEDNKFKSYHHNRQNKNSLSNNYVYTIFEDSKNQIWIGTAKGLNLLNEKENSFKVFYHKNGLSNDVMSGIAEDKYGYLWISSFNGITRFNPERNTFSIFTTKNGLPGNYFNPNALIQFGENIFAGSNRGLVVLNPSEFDKSNADSKVLISSIIILNNEEEDKTIFNANDGIELDYDNNSIKILLSTSDYNYSGLLRFKYKLDRGWNELSSNELLLSNLSPGTHNLQIAVVNSSDVSANGIKNILIIVHPPFWQTWWFLLLSIGAIAFISYSIYKFLVSKKIKRVLEIEKIKIEQGEKIRRKTAIDFHDELGHRLTRISLLSAMIRKKLQNQYIELNPLLDKITEISSALYEGTKDFIWSIDPTNDSLYELMIRLKDFGDDLFTDGQINFEVKGLSENLSQRILDMDWKRHIALILKEGMNNSLKHSHGTRVSLETKILNDELQIILEDDGIGLDYKAKTGNGIRNMKSRAQKLNASIELVSEHGKGTKIFFKGKFPVKSVNYN